MIQGKKISIIFLAVLFLSFFSPSNVYAYGDLQEVLPQKTKPSKGITIPKGTFFRVNLMQTISSEFNKSNDEVKAIVLSDFSILDNIIIPQKSVFAGTILDLKKAEQGRDGYFFVDFDRIILPDGNIIEIKAHLYVTSGSKMIGGALSPRIGHKTTMFRVAAFGTRGIMQLQPDGPRVMGQETKIKAGSEILVELDEPLKL
ncbi:MAG: hypothetical protein PHX18_07300 [Candidatus Gastranaerophilales bacterium]|nr:hypothetical protein [Candidatus Gastranaerophilales bacterium]